MNEDKLKNQQYRANAARRILDDDVFNDAINYMREAIERNFRDCDIADTERLTRIKMMDETLTHFIKYFENVVKKGRVAENSLIHLEKEKQWQSKKQAI